MIQFDLIKKIQQDLFEFGARFRKGQRSKKFENYCIFFLDQTFEKRKILIFLVGKKLIKKIVNFLKHCTILLEHSNYCACTRPGSLKLTLTKVQCNMIGIILFAHDGLFSRFLLESMNEHIIRETRGTSGLASEPRKILPSVLSINNLIS